jgi:hypothetical protein
MNAFLERLSKKNRVARSYLCFEVHESLTRLPLTTHPWVCKALQEARYEVTNSIMGARFAIIYPKELLLGNVTTTARR